MLKKQYYKYYIIEGPDGCGKSTFIQKYLQPYLRKKTENNENYKEVYIDGKKYVDRFKFKNLPTAVEAQFYSWAKLDSVFNPLLFNRHIYTDKVYSEIYRNGEGDYYEDLEKIWSDIDTKVFFLLPPLENVWYLLQKRGDSFVNTSNDGYEKYKTLYNQYLKVYEEIKHINKSLIIPKWNKKKEIYEFDKLDFDSFLLK